MGKGWVIEKMFMEKQIIATTQAPQAIGPYSQAVQVGNLLFVSGQIPINPATGALVTDTFEAQVSQVLKNIEAILQAGAEKARAEARLLLAKVRNAVGIRSLK